MSAANGVGERSGPALSRPRQIEANAWGTLATLFRAPRRRVPWPSLPNIALGLAAAGLAVIASMLLLDLWAITVARHLPIGVQVAFNRLTDFGLSGWFLWPLGLALLALAVLDGPALPPFPRHVLAAWAVRLGFVFTAIALPGLFTTIIKRLIGRARPFVSGDNVWAYLPFGWRVDHASLPSGHGTTAFAALVAIGAIFPQARALLWVYAILIALSRVVVTAHYPSDVLAAAVVGATGAWLVRNWFAERGLVFIVGPDGSVRAKPGPSLARIVKAVARCLRGA